MSEVLADLMLWFLLLSKLQSKLSILKFNNSVLSLSTENGNSKLFETSKRCYQKLTFKPANGIKFEKFQFPSTPRKSFNKQYRTIYPKYKLLESPKKALDLTPKPKLDYKRLKKYNNFQPQFPFYFSRFHFKLKKQVVPAFTFIQLIH